MSKRRISSPQVSSSQFVAADWLNSSIRSHKFVGVSLAGGKTNKTAVSHIEYYHDQQAIFLKELKTDIRPKKSESADKDLIDLINLGNPRFIGLNAPLSLPKCLRCKLLCPGYEKCTQPEIVWLSDKYKEKSKSKKPKKIFTPYTERCTEFYISNFLEEQFHPPEALGANKAALTARAHYLLRHLPKKNIFEFYPQLNVWRIGRSIGIRKFHLQSYKHSISGSSSREIILNKLIKEDIVFIYDEDLKKMISNFYVFEAFIGALTGVLKFNKQIEDRPTDFPKSESWLSIPRKELNW